MWTHSQLHLCGHNLPDLLWSSGLANQFTIHPEMHFKCIYTNLSSRGQALSESTEQKKPCILIPVVKSTLYISMQEHAVWNCAGSDGLQKIRLTIVQWHRQKLLPYMIVLNPLHLWGSRFTQPVCLYIFSQVDISENAIIYKTLKRQI